MSERGEDIFQICNDVVEAKTTVGEGIARLETLKETDRTVPSRLVDILYVLEIDATTPEKKEKYAELVQGVRETFVPPDVLTLELNANEDVHKKALIRHKTRLYFKQTKFNLLREESEGYAKLVTELLEVGLSDVTPEAMKTRVHCLIGQFNLDPNRVLVIVLQCFECLPKQKDFFIRLLRLMTPNLDNLLGLVGFQFLFYQTDGKKTPFSLYTMTAALIQAEMVDLMKITGALKPNAEGIKDTHRLRASNAAARAKKAETIITTQIAAETSSRSARDMDREASTDGQATVGVALSAVAAVQDAEDDKILADLSEENTLSVNQKLGLVCALLEAGEWAYAQHLIDRLPEFYAVQSGPRICRAIARLIDAAIDLFYRQKCVQRMLLSSCSADKEPRPLATGMTRCESWSDLVEHIAPILWYLGPRIGHSSSTTTKLIRLITVFFEERTKAASTSDERLANTMMDIVDECLLPSLSMQVNSPNVALSEELWTLLQLFSYEQRYRLYGRWKTTHTSRHPELSVNRAKVLGRTKYILKRLSKETVKVMGRQLGKLCHIHPMTVLDYMLSMVQTFDNFIGPVVESLKFLTSLEFDVLSFCLIDQLASPDRLQLKASDGNLSLWLQALGTMVGSIYKKYNVELAGILNYVANQLKNNKGFDLLILREIIQNMSSVESSLNVTEEQLEALTGGEVLKLEAGGFSTARNKRASNRLRDALLEGDLALGLCVLVAQQREFIIHQQADSLPLKLIGEMVDQCRDTLVQFGSYIMQTFKYEEYQKRIATTAELMEEYGLPLDVSMFLTRIIFNHMISDSYGESKKLRRSLEADSGSKLDNHQKFVFFKSAMDNVVDKFCQELSTVHTLVDSTQVKTVGMKTIVTFWMLSSYDIEVPTDAYDRAVENLKRQGKEIDPELSKNKRAKELERLTGLEAKLKDEQRRQTEHVERIRMWLKDCQAELFVDKSNSSIPFFATCVLRRAIFSESDAIFTAKFLLLLHAQRTTFFQTMIFFDKTFMDLLPFVSGLTEHEASAFGRFLEILLFQAHKWNQKRELYDAECLGSPGFHLKVGGKSAHEALNWDTFRLLTSKWQGRTLKSFVAVLKNPKAEYSLIRNSFVIMFKMITCFPVIVDHHSQLEDVVLALQKREKGKRDDLALLAMSYAARLKSIQKNMLEKAQYQPIKEKPKKVVPKPAPASNGTEAAAPVEKVKGDKLERDKKRPTESPSVPEPKKRIRAEKERGKENVEEISSEKKTNGKEGTATPVNSEEKGKDVEEGEVSPENPTPAKKSKVAQNGREKEGKERESKEREKESKEERTPKSSKRREEQPPPAEKKDRRGEEKKKEDDKTEKREHDGGRKKEEEVKEKTETTARRTIEKRAEEKKVERRDAERRTVKDEKETEKRRKEPVKEKEDSAGPAPAPISQKDEKAREKREHVADSKKDDKRDSHRRTEVRSSGRADEKKEEKAVKETEKHHSYHKEHKMEGKEEKAKEKEEKKKETRDHEKKEEARDRKRITLDHREEPGVKISRTLSGGKMVKESKDSVPPATARKHRAISPPKDVSSRRTSTSGRSSRR